MASLVGILAAGSPAFFTLIRYAQLSGLSLLLLSLALVALVRDRRFLAGVVIGLMVFKPQLGVVIGLVMILAGEWRVVAGAALAASAELAAAWLVSGSTVMRQYADVLVTLARDPSLVQIYPGRSSFAAWLCPPADRLACRSLGRLDRRGGGGGLDRRADLEERRAPDDEVGPCWSC